MGDEIKYDLTFNKRNYKQFLDLISNNSITIELIKKIKWKFFNSVKQKYDIDNLNNIYNENYEYINYKYAKKIYNTDNLKNKYSYLYKRYKKRLEDIYIKSKDFNSKIIFITQIKFDGLRDEKLFLLNEITKEFSKEKQIKIIKLDEKFAGEINDFYDQNHPTEKGSDKISEIVYTELLKIIFY